MKYSNKLAELLKHDEWYTQTEEGYFPTDKTPEEYKTTVEMLNETHDDE